MLGIRAKPREPRRRSGIWNVAERQHGVVTTTQLSAHGIGSDGITRRVRSGRLYRLHRGVYLVGFPKVSREARWMAAVLAYGAGAVLSHRSGAALWGLLADDRMVVDVLVPAGRQPRRGILIHRADGVRPEDRAIRDGIPVTSVTRTLIDCAGILDERTLRRAVIEAERERWLEPHAVREMCGQGRKGSGRLRAIIEDELAPYTAADSELELRFLELCRRYCLPTPEVNVYIEGFKVDALWPGQRLIVELDGDNFHRTAGDRRRDAMRDRRLQLAGFVVLRFGWGEVTKGATQAAEEIRAALNR